ncbi:MAG: ABC transporter permease [Planctomycetota bacterium]
MVTGVLFRKLLRDMRRRSGALIAIAAVIAVGVSSFVSMAGAYLDLHISRTAYYADYRLADFTVDLKRAPASTLEYIRGLPNVKEARGRVSINVLLDLPNTPEPVAGLAISMPRKRRPVLNDVLVKSGTWFSASGEGEVIVDDAFARANRIIPGSRIKMLLVDRQHELLVVGTAMSPEFVFLLPPAGGLAPDPKMFGVFYLAEDFLRKAGDLDGAYNQVLGKAHDDSRNALDETLDLLERKLDAYGVINAARGDEQPSVRFLAEELKGLKASASIMPPMFLGVAALVLNVLLTRMVAQQRTIIGVLKALGYTSRRILAHYLAYGAVVGIAGALFGAAFGIWMQAGMDILYRRYFALPAIEPHFYAVLFFPALAVSVFFALAGSVRGVLAAVRLEPADAMRPPPPEIGGRIPFERVALLWRWFSFRTRMMLRAVFRNPLRSTVGAFAAGVSTMLLFAVLHNYGAFRYLIDHEYERLSHEDFVVATREPVDLTGVSEVSSLQSIGYCEPQLQMACDLSNGPYQRRVAVTGLTPEGRLLTPLDSAGNPVTIPAEGLVITRKLADLLGVRAGSSVVLRPLVGLRRRARATVVGVVDTYLGLSAYADIRYLSRLVGEESVANAIAGTIAAKGISRRSLNALKERPAVVNFAERTRTLKLIDEAMGSSLGVFLGIVVLFAGIIAVGSLLNMALVSLSEREREVGSLRVLGYTPGQILHLFAGESMILNLSGIAVGLVGGIGLAKLLSMAFDTEIYRFPLVIRPWQFLLTGMLMIAFFVIAQAFVYKIIIGLKWLDVLKSRE